MFFSADSPLSPPWAGLLLLALAGAADLANSLFKSNLSAVKSNVMSDFLKPVTSTLPLSLVTPSILRLKLLLASSFFISVCAPKLNVPFMPPFGRLGSLMSRLPASLGKSNIKVSRLPLKGEENVPVIVRLPCTADKSPEMPLLCNALGDPFISANTKLAFITSLFFVCDKTAITFLPLTSSFKICNFGAVKSMPCFAPSNVPLAANFKSSTKNSISSGLASTSPLAVMSIALPPSMSPTIWLSKPFTLKCLVSGSTKKLPANFTLAAISGWLPVTVKSVFKSTGSAKAMRPEAMLSLLMAYFAPVVSSK